MCIDRSGEKMKRVYLLYFILFLYASGFSSDKLLWPTDASFNLTATFGEYRPGHFHTGIDIKTWGREGYKVFAVDDGYVEKVSVSPYGYGKVLFFKLNNFEVFNTVSVDFKSKHCYYFMNTCFAGSTRIHVQQIIFFVIKYF